jgi:hypothetical protein
MVDITDPVETIVSILKNGSTGLGTSGYEVTDDNAAAASILVSYKLSEEELKEVFGGTQDYDVVLTVEKGEVKDEWLGLSTKEWVVPVIITIYVIDKFSTVGSGHKYITAPLVRSKVENALRNFIKDHVTSAGGSIHIWSSKTWKNEEDRTVRPVLYKCIVTTETWTYYDPPAIYAVSLSSKEDDNSTTNLGTITLTRGSNSLPLTMNLPEGTYFLEFTLPAVHDFSSWVVTGLVSVGNSSSRTTTIIVAGAGTLTAVYVATTPIISIECRDDGNPDPTSRIDIIGEDFFNDGETVELTAGEYMIVSDSAPSHSFVSWEVTGGISVLDPDSSVTFLTVVTSGTLRMNVTYSGCC